ncbi:cystatin-B [Ictalurus punctatus]|uniref:Cystatin-B n=1 Tax=Ictalurus punctatus TaxID=7998 RepID=A0A2D0PY35_ICTPU|nr:cystatin-B [Ictalurus punctatus]XP_017310347.1 cystatin-B [Ictalurus punctatus]XP_017310349.1 cystatin-B [Ictalurus punctatus]
MSTCIAGGWTKWRTTDDDDVKNICELVKPEAEEMEKTKFTVYVPLNYRSQVVAGINYEMKVFVGNDSCLFLRVFQGPGPDPESVLQRTTVFSLPSIITH